MAARFIRKIVSKKNLRLAPLRLFCASPTYVFATNWQPNVRREGQKEVNFPYHIVCDAREGGKCVKMENLLYNEENRSGTEKGLKRVA